VGSVIYLEKKRAFTNNTGPEFWAIASGKGGVGRSFFTSSLAITLGRQGYRVLMVDCDTNGGTLHSWMGQSPNRKTITDYFQNSDSIENYIVPTSQERISLVAGDSSMWHPRTGTFKRTIEMMEQLKKLSYDVILFDLAAGCDQQNIEILKKADQTFLITSPEGGAIERTYRWIENYISYVALNEIQRRSLFEFNKKARNEKEGSSLFATRDFLEKMRKDMTGDSSFFGPIKMIVNQARNFEDDRLGESIRSVCNKHYYLDLQNAGSLQYDNAVWQCARQRVPVLIHQPFNPLVGQIQGLVKQILDQPSQRAVV
jgi:flagellar biosynthesis protein FlhG